MYFQSMNSLLVGGSFGEDLSSVALFSTDGVVEDDEEDEEGAHTCAVVVQFVFHFVLGYYLFVKRFYLSKFCDQYHENSFELRSV